MQRSSEIKDSDQLNGFSLSSWELGIGVAAGAVLAVLGPVGTFGADLTTRFLFWVPLLTLGAYAGGLMARRTSRRLQRGERQWHRSAILAFAVGFPMGLIAWGLAKLLFTPSPTYSFSVFFWPPLLVSALMTALMVLLNTPGVETKVTPGEKPKLLDRLPTHQQGADILAVSSEDHYSRVFTSAGESLILLRLGDAIAELEGIEGAQVHRSWWVARDAIRNAEKHGRNWQLVLSNGSIAPVSRANTRVLREANWLS